MVSLFSAAAAQLLADMPAEEAVARALAHMTGQTSMQVSTSCGCLDRFVEWDRLHASWHEARVDTADHIRSNQRIVKSTCEQLPCAGFSTAIAEHTVMHTCSAQARSLLTAHEDFTTLQFCSGGATLDRPGFVFGFLRRRGLPDADVEEVHIMLGCTAHEQQHNAALCGDLITSVFGCTQGVLVLA